MLAKVTFLRAHLPNIVVISCQIVLKSVFGSDIDRFDWNVGQFRNKQQRTSQPTVFFCSATKQRFTKLWKGLDKTHYRLRITYPSVFYHSENNNITTLNKFACWILGIGSHSSQNLFGQTRGGLDSGNCLSGSFIAKQSRQGWKQKNKTFLWEMSTGKLPWKTEFVCIGPKHTF